MIKRSFRKTVQKKLTGALLCVGVSAYAHAASFKKPGIAVVPSGRLPVSAQQSASAGLLRYVSCDETLLYLEQDAKHRLLVLDVTDPAHVHAAATVDLDPDHAFDFVQPISRDEELIRYRSTNQSAVLSLANPRKPALLPLNAAYRGMRLLPKQMLQVIGVTEPKYRDYELRDEKGQGDVIATIKDVAQQIVDPSSGATYLLGEQGLTVVRDKQVERGYSPCEVEAMDAPPHR